MAVPTYDELLAHYDMDRSIMRETFDDKCLRQFSLTLDVWEALAKFLEMPNLDIANIKSHEDAVVQTLKMLECWKQRRGSMATYEAMVKALLQISRTDLAEKVITLRKLSRSSTTIKTLSCHKESSLTASTSPANSSRIENAYSPAVISPLSQPTTPSKHTKQEVKQTLQDFEDDFYELVTFVEETLKKSNVKIDKITRRFSMLPQSIRRQHQTDHNYEKTRRRILKSRSIKELFDNLTALKHWNYMTPDTLAHIVKDVKIDDVHKKINEYKDKLKVFKANTKLRELINTSFNVPDYCMELTMEVEGWEDKTIQEVENTAVNMIRQAAYSGQNVCLGWKGIHPGSIKLTFILVESIHFSPEKKICEDSGVLSIQLDGQEYITDINWITSDTVSYATASKGLNVLILAPDLSLPHPEAVARRLGQLTKEDKLKLQKQGLPPDCQNELEIIKGRCELDKKLKVIGVKSGKVLREEAIKQIALLLRTTYNDGASICYIGAGRRGTGDWCFENGFITFRDIAQLYLSTSHNFKGHVLSIVSDCSYSGCWVRDCMEFLDEQGVQPCGHKAREKGMIIKMFTSCKSNEIPTEYRYSVDGMDNDENTGEIGSLVSTQLLKTQTTNDIDSSQLNCSNDSIDETCTLQSGYTWKTIVQILEYHNML